MSMFRRRRRARRRRNILLFLLVLLLTPVAVYLRLAYWNDAPHDYGRMSEIYVPPGPDHTPPLTVDPHWRPLLPEGWTLGEISGVSVDDRDHIWILHRPWSLTEAERGLIADPPRSTCCIPAPPVIELAPDGTYLRSWGGPGTADRVNGIDQWPAGEHGLYIDLNRNVWVTGNGFGDGHILKFSDRGVLKLRIGTRYLWLGGSSTETLGRPADVWVDTTSDTVYVADGYRNSRVIAFDATDGTPLGQWGAYAGAGPGSAPRSGDPDFDPPVHCVTGIPGALLFVCDRRGNRVQVFDIIDRHTLRYSHEYDLMPETRGRGSAWDAALSPDLKTLYVADGENERIWVIDRTSRTIRGRVGRGGHQAGEFGWLHQIATDSAGNLYTVETRHGRKMQKWVPPAAAAPEAVAAATVEEPAVTNENDTGQEGAGDSDHDN